MPSKVMQGFLFREADMLKAKGVEVSGYCQPESWGERDGPTHCIVINDGEQVLEGEYSRFKQDFLDSECPVAVLRMRRALCVCDVIDTETDNGMRPFAKRVEDFKGHGVTKPLSVHIKAKEASQN